MKDLRLLSAFLLLLMGSAGLFSCDKDDDDATPDQDIVAFVADNPDYELLAAAVVKADLAGILSGPGPFTVFAPNDDAFQAFLNAAGTNTIENTPKEVLAAVLTNHVLGGEFRAANLTTGYASTLSATSFGNDIYNTLYVNTAGGVTINGNVEVTKGDIFVKNGVIHAVDKVIALPTVVTFVAADPSFSLLLQALTATGLTTDFVAALSGNGPFTVFAPTNAAFQALLNSNPAWNTLADVPTDLLEKVLLYHVTGAGNVRASNLVDGQTVNTLANESFTIRLANGGASIETGQNTANIIFTDVQATNGVVHVIDSVLLPE